MNLSRKEKLDQIERIMANGHSRRYYMQQKISQAKEAIAYRLTYIKTLYRRMQGKILRMKLEKMIQEIHLSVKSNDVSIISQNCIGGVFYHDLGMQFLSPTINLFIKEPDFVRFALNLQHYMDCELEMHWEEEYPVGNLDDIEIHFKHYKTCKEAKEQWNRRKQRINWNKIIILSTDRDGFDDVMFQQWKHIPFPKVLSPRSNSFLKTKTVCFFQSIADKIVCQI